MELDVNVLTNGWVIAGVIASFLVAFIALGLGVASIIQTQRLQKRERKERKLITVIEWATNILKCETATPLPPLPIEGVVNSALKLEEIMEIINRVDFIRSVNVHTNLIMRYQNLDVMGTRIVLIAKTLDKQFSCKLGNLAQKTANKLKAHVELGPKWIEGEVTHDEYIKHWKSLVGSAKSLVKKAEEVTD